MFAKRLTPCILPETRLLRTPGIPFCVDLRNRGFVGVGSAVAWAMCLLKARNDGAETQILYDKHLDSTGYLKRIDFFSVVGVRLEDGFERHASAGKFLEINQVEASGASDLAEKLSEIVRTQTCATESAASALDYAFGEVLDNVCTHSCAKIPGLVASQYFPRKKAMEFCIADAGVGIPCTLSRNRKYSGLGQVELLERSFDMGVGENTDVAESGTEAGYGCGFGLAFLANLAAASGGCLLVASHSAALAIDKDGRHKVNGAYFPGTVIDLEMPADVHISASDLNPEWDDAPFAWSASDGLGEGDIIHEYDLW